MRFVDIIIIIFLLQSQSTVSAPLILVVVSSTKSSQGYLKLQKIRYNYISGSSSPLNNMNHSVKSCQNNHGKNLIFASKRVNISINQTLPRLLIIPPSSISRALYIALEQNTDSLGGR